MAPCLLAGRGTDVISANGCALAYILRQDRTNSTIQSLTGKHHCLMHR